MLWCFFSVLVRSYGRIDDQLETEGSFYGCQHEKQFLGADFALVTRHLRFQSSGASLAEGFSTTSKVKEVRSKFVSKIQSDIVMMLLLSILLACICKSDQIIMYDTCPFIYYVWHVFVAFNLIKIIIQIKNGNGYNV